MVFYNWWHGDIPNRSSSHGTVVTWTSEVTWQILRLNQLATQIAIGKRNGRANLGMAMACNAGIANSAAASGGCENDKGTYYTIHT